MSTSLLFLPLLRSLHSPSPPESSQKETEVCSCVMSLLCFENVQLAPISFNQSFIIWLPYPSRFPLMCPHAPAPAVQASVLFLTHAKNASVRPLVPSVDSMPPFQWVLPRTTPSQFASFPYFLLIFCSPKISKTAAFVLLVCCLPLPLECRLHEVRGFCPFYSVLSLASRKSLAHTDCSGHVEWVTKAKLDRGIKH